MDVTGEFIARSRHYLNEEYPAKIRLCLDVIPAGALWARSDESSNSIGNLLLHLAGNVRQWIVSGVGGAPDARFRAGEFTARDGGDMESLWNALRATLSEADAVIAAQSAETLLQRRTVQGRDVTVMHAIYHVVEHLSLHTGQIILLAKLHAPGQVHFYDDAGGLAVPIWRDQAAR